MSETLPLTWAEFAKQRGFGMCNCGEHLGVMVGEHGSEANCPRGWTFIANTATVEQIQESIDECKKGRATWPAKA